MRKHFSSSDEFVTAAMSILQKNLYRYEIYYFEEFWNKCIELL